MREEQLRERLYRKERDNRYLRKDSDDRKVMEEVFDTKTLIAVKQMLNRGDIAFLNGIVSSGKEARVYWGVAPDDSPRAVKIYLTASAEFKKRAKYIVGDKRFGRVPRASREIIKLWVQKEFKNLQLAGASGIRVPHPYAYNENVLVMEFIGQPPSAAPTLAEVEVDKDDYEWTIQTVKKLLKSAGLVHADLSEYNIFKFKEERVLFDMGSSVDASHPEAREFLRRDISNIVRFFSKRGIPGKDADRLVREMMP